MATWGTKERSINLQHQLTAHDFLTPALPGLRLVCQGASLLVGLLVHVCSSLQLMAVATHAAPALAFRGTRVGWYGASARPLLLKDSSSQGSRNSHCVSCRSSKSSGGNYSGSSGRSSGGKSSGSKSSGSTAVPLFTSLACLFEEPCLP